MEGYGYTTSLDGTRIYYHVYNPDASHTVILCDGIGCHGFIWKYLVDCLVRDFKLVHIHYRGHGNSAIPLDYDNLTIEHIGQDIDAVVEALALEHYVLMGHSMGVQVVLHHYLTRQNNCRGTVLLCGSHGNPLHTFHDATWLNRLIPYLQRTVTRHPMLAQTIWNGVLPTRFAIEFAKLFEVNGHFMADEDFQPYFNDLCDINVEVFVTLLKNANQHTSEARLGEVNVPSLVVVGEKDTFTPAWVSRRMQHRIPHSELLEVRAGTHTTPLEFPELVNLRVEKFLKSRCYPNGG